MSDAPPIVIAIEYGLLIATSVAWLYLVVQWVRGKLTFRESPNVDNAAPHWAAVMMALLSMLLSLGTVIATRAKPSTAQKQSQLEADAKTETAEAADDFEKVREIAAKDLQQELQIVKVQEHCFSQALFLLIFLVPLFADQRTKPSRLGIHVRSFSRQLLVGCWGFALALGPVMLVFLLTEPFRSEDSRHQLLKLISNQPTFRTLFWVTAAAGVCAPLVEELQYRVILQSTFRRLLPRWAAIIVTAFLFAAVHHWPDNVPLIPLALVLGTVYDITRSYWSVVTVHVLFNATNIALLWLTVTAN